MTVLSQKQGRPHYPSQSTSKAFDIVYHLHC